MQKPSSPLVILLLSLLLASNAHAAPPTKAQNFINHNNWSFVENKGQLTDEKGNLLSDVKYYSHDGGAHLYCRPGMISFVFSKVETTKDESISEATGAPVETGHALSLRPRQQPKPTKITTCRADLVLVDANPHAVIAASEQQAYYENYYTTGSADHGITDVHTYKKITYQNIYPHIDMILTATSSGLEYSFLVHPGGDVQNIQLHWNGINAAAFKADGSIKYTLPMAAISESAPRSFTEGNKVQSSFVKKGYNYGFKVAAYDKTKDLLIDPDLAWSTFFGGKNDDEVYAMSADGAGNTYITGGTSSTGLSSSGAHQSSFTADVDAFVAKFNSGGNKIWSTYYGGQGTETATAACVTLGFIYISGTTTSSTNMATSGAYQTTSPANTTPAFLSQFSSASGKLYAATYFGYNININCIAAGASGEIYITGNVVNCNNLTTSSSYQPTHGGGSADAFLTKFNNPNILDWSTFFGGGGADFGTGVTVDASGNVYLTGSSQSTGAIATKGAYQTSMMGNYDAFLARFTSKGALAWSTYFGGANTDYSYGTCTDASGNIYITGATGSDGLGTSGAFLSTKINSYNAFLTKFSSSGTLAWSTYYGANGSGGYENGIKLAYDGEGHIFLLGSVNGSGSGLATAGAYQTSKSGKATNAFLVKFDVSGQRKWATYFGGDQNDVPVGLALDHLGDVYLAGYDAGGSSNLTTSGAFQTSSAGKKDGFLAKFNHFYDNDAGIPVIYAPSGDLCSGQHPLKVLLKNYGSAKLSSTEIDWSLNGLSTNKYKWSGALAPDSSVTVVLDSVHTFSAGGYKFLVYTANPNGIADSLHSNDTSFLAFTVYDVPKTSAGGLKDLCLGSNDTLGIAPVANHSYAWTSNPAGLVSTSARPVVSPTKNTWYRVVETVNGAGCTNMDSVLVSVHPLPVLHIGFSQSICNGTTASIGPSAVAGYDYKWLSQPPGFSSTDANPTVSPNVTTEYKLTVSAAGCSRTDSVEIEVKEAPVAATGPDTTICSGATLTLGKPTTKGHYYAWSSDPAGFVSYTANPSVKPDTTVKYILEEGITTTGCTVSHSVNITVNPVPVAKAGGNHDICKGKYHHWRESGSRS